MCIKFQFLRVSADYAKLLGHQNPKQKIHYVVKLKEENISLKQVQLWFSYGTNYFNVILSGKYKVED